MRRWNPSLQLARCAICAHSETVRDDSLDRAVGHLAVVNDGASGATGSSATLQNGSFKSDEPARPRASLSPFLSPLCLSTHAILAYRRGIMIGVREHGPVNWGELEPCLASNILILSAPRR